MSSWGSPSSKKYQLHDYVQATFEAQTKRVRTLIHRYEWSGRDKFNKQWRLLRYADEFQEHVERAKEEVEVA